eukprot:TRINITY_DN1034_c0_g1_i1.p1 TRINITY_DN1034_c0_g1~~TRINITY_DN1034_c0_g1_i1.p1  ORF type:complete len:429 (+),score=25.19 TRINITY_DN1034_c0_g1_i1:37-1323(+)
MVGLKGQDDQEAPLLTPSNDHDGKERNGTWFYACLHCATAMIGAGILGLPWAYSYLGWFGGTMMLLLAFLVSYFAAQSLVILHEQDNKRFDTYTHLGLYVFGHKYRWVVPMFQITTCVGAAISYVITGAQSIQHVYELCFPQSPATDITLWILLFGAVQLVLSQLPDFHSLRFVSLMGTLMAIGYSMIAVVSSVVHSLEDEMPSFGQRNSDNLGQMFTIGNAVGSVMYAFGGLSAMLEIQATLPSPSMKTMRLGISSAYVLGMVLYSLVAFSGYRAFGAGVADNVLISLGKPAWLVAIANAMVALHVAAGYQVFSMIVFISSEQRFFLKMKGSQVIVLRIIYRTAYVLATVTVAAYLPFFSAVNGFLGALCISMGTFILPYLLSLLFFGNRVSILLRITYVFIIIIMILLSVYALAGALYNIVILKTG